ncbi:MAG TPA: hypothetical protein VKA77_18005 [Mycobacterium sp.]|nr:hypothetical protein [Mycobacterium sp.]
MTRSVRFRDVVVNVVVQDGTRVIHRQITARYLGGADAYRGGVDSFGVVDGRDRGAQGGDGFGVACLESGAQISA